jgi:hypothetical protein
MARRARLENAVGRHQGLEGGVGEERLDGIGRGGRPVGQHDALQNSTPVRFGEGISSIATRATARLSHRRVLGF